MKKTRFFKLLSIALCIVLIAAIALMTGCNDNPNPNAVSSMSDAATNLEVKNVGEGDTQFDFTVTDKDGKETAFVVSTNKSTVGEALLEAGLIAGEDSEYGLYVKTVNGITLDYNTDGMYWAFYVDGGYAVSGVDTTPINPDEAYAFKAEK